MRVQESMFGTCIHKPSVAGSHHPGEVTSAQMKDNRETYHTVHSAQQAISFWDRDLTRRPNIDHSQNVSTNKNK